MNLKLQGLVTAEALKKYVPSKIDGLSDKWIDITTPTIPSDTNIVFTLMSSFMGSKAISACRAVDDDGKIFAFCTRDGLDFGMPVSGIEYLRVQ